MDTQNQDPNINSPRPNGRVFGGMFLLAIGAIFFLKEADFFFFPHWLFSWPMILIAVGVYTGLKHNFRGAGWLIPIVIGSIFLLDRFDIGLDLHRFIFPAIIICIGLTMILRPKNRGITGGGWDNWGGGRYRRNRNYGRQEYTGNTGYSANTQTASTGTNTSAQEGVKPDFVHYGEDIIDITSILGSTQRIVVSKNFKGGDVTCFMGGAEINLAQADITGTVVMDITTVMGGVKLIVPPNWEIKSLVTPFLGGVEDKRQVQGKIIDFNKVLVLKGTAFMGGIELRSY
jgi:predicted membrane protein